METSIGCSVIIHNTENKVLISQRSASKRCFPLMWELVGGGLEAGEQPEDCIRREAMEEIGCELYDLQLFDVNILYDKDQYMGIVFTAIIKNEPKYNDEIIETRWVSKEEIGQYVFMTDGRERLEKYFNGK